MEEQRKALSVKASGIKIKSITAKSSDTSVLKVKTKIKTKSVILIGVKKGKAKVTMTVKATVKGKTNKYKITTSVTVKKFIPSGVDDIGLDYSLDLGKTIVGFRSMTITVMRRKMWLGPTLRPGSYGHLLLIRWLKNVFRNIVPSRRIIIQVLAQRIYREKVLCAHFAHKR